MAKPILPTLPTLPKFDAASALALYDANVETLLAVQKVLLDLTRTYAERQVTFATDAHGKIEAAFKGGVDTKKQPVAYVEEAKVALEKAVADAKETVELGIKAQGEVADLLAKRVQANLEQVKALAA